MSELAASPLLGPVPRLREADRRGYVRPMTSGVDRASAAIEALVSRFGAMVRSVGVRRGLVEADLDEVLQEVRIRLWRARDGGKNLEELGSSYLYHVATSAALDLLRRRRARGGDRAADVTEAGDLPASASSPHEQVEAQELAAQIDRALESLSADRRVAVRFHLSGYDRDHIARVLGWSEPRTRNLLYRGLADLRERLAAMGIRPRSSP